MKIKLTFLFFLFIAVTFSQEKNSSIYSNLSIFFSENKDSMNIKTIVDKFDKGEFYKEKDQRIYKKLDTKTLWSHFYVKPSKNKIHFKYFTISNSYLPYGKIYLKKGNKIDSLYRVSNNHFFPHKNIFYRNPVWKIPVDSILTSDVFLKVKNSSGRTRMVMYLETENDFLKRVETEYFYFGLFISFLISMTLILVFFSVLKKEYAVLFYALYIITVLFEFLAGKGLGVQYFWSDSTFFINNIRSFSQTVGVFCIGYFYTKFYKLKASQTISKGIFKWGTYLTIPIILLYVYKYCFGGLINLYLTVWTVLKIIIFIWVLNHLYLTIKKQLPAYLVIAFILPILAVINGQIMNPEVHNQLAIKFSGPNIYYITLSLEILLFTRFIFGSVIDTQQKYFKLKKVSDELKYNFQNKTLEIQQEERNKLVSNVHDTFGGYLEALKLRLLQKTENSPEKIQEILDAFYKEYRYLLNSLYSPKINSENFVENLIEFCQKLNQLTEHNISYQFDIENTELSQEKCLHIYRIISELITNAIKYSKASEININLNQKVKNLITLEVSDNGIGFDKKMVNKKGFGLNNIETRVNQMKGSLKIDSNNSGTFIEIQIPENE
ncbi:ATP-binding protein [Polaribacter sp. Hel1_85]|uniref:sensor histidine kinase n=1 Tax=Polaribacter sp. Hel1_85 TaxID=1250005 RepID=UPI000569657A|nr:ATP-binding protein [Polaribacter sp. Hel1_85]